MEILLFILLCLVIYIAGIFIATFVLNKIDKMLFNYCKKKVNKMNIKTQKNG